MTTDAEYDLVADHSDSGQVTYDVPALYQRVECPVIAVDVMGGDLGPQVAIAGALAASRTSKCKVLLVGREAEIHTVLAGEKISGADFEVVHAAEVVDMGEKPSDILRRKKDASIQVACRLVKEGRAHGLVSPGHSGATVACAMFIMGRIPGVERLALATLIPTETTPSVLLDVGANVDCKPYHLFQFALMGDALARSIMARQNPKVGILSIGEEEGKGNMQVKDTYDLLKLANNLNFVGNVEGRELFTGKIDVILCDGFVGNVALKLAEGLGSSLSRMLKKALFSSLAAKIGTLFAKGALARFSRFLDYAEYGGAPLLGVQGTAIVCHGRSNVKAITNATLMAADSVRKGTNDVLVQAISANEELTRYSKAAIH